MSTDSVNRDKIVHRTHFNERELFSSSTTADDSHTPLSETVTTLASNVYKELERIIRNFGESSVKDLMPVMISILGSFQCPSTSISSLQVCLESLDGALHERDESKLESDALREQNEQLFQQYEREKSVQKEYQQVNVAVLCPPSMPSLLPSIPALPANRRSSGRDQARERGQIAESRIDREDLRNQRAQCFRSYRSIGRQGKRDETGIQAFARSIQRGEHRHSLFSLSISLAASSCSKPIAIIWNA